MTDKPDVAALVARLQSGFIRQSETDNGVFEINDAKGAMKQAASELTRLAAEREQTYELAYSVARHDMDNQLSEAKAEIARLADDRDHWQYLAEEWERQYDTAHSNACEWETYHDQAKTEIARLRDAVTAGMKACDAFDAPVSKSQFVNGQATAAQQIRAALKPDTGEKPKGMWPDWGDSPNGFDGPGGAE